MSPKAKPLIGGSSKLQQPQPKPRPDPKPIDIGGNKTIETKNNVIGDQKKPRPKVPPPKYQSDTNPIAGKNEPILSDQSEESKHSV